jgi:hypothetical protein
MWTRCETPDTADIARLIAMEGVDEQKTRSIVENALAEGGGRAVLEAYVSKIAEKVYQNRITRRKRKAA